MLSSGPPCPLLIARSILLGSTCAQALAALVQGRACGLLATSSDLELGLLQSCFQLDDYEHLVKVKQPRTRTAGVGCCAGSLFLLLRLVAEKNWLGFFRFFGRRPSA